MSILGIIGRGYSTYQLVVTIIFSMIFIGLGIYLMTGKAPQPQPIPGQPPNPISNLPATIIGGIMIFMGIVSPIAAWLRRKLIRSSPELAEVAGGLDVIRLLGV
jgi:hypothetical protein